MTVYVITETVYEQDNQRVVYTRPFRAYMSIEAAEAFVKKANSQVPTNIRYDIESLVIEDMDA